MQSVLIVSATLAECQGLLKRNFICIDGESCYLDAFADFKADLLITGVGAVATTFYLTKLLSTTNYRFLLNIGLAGSFTKTVPLGMIVSVRCDQFGDLGAENHNDFIDIFDLGLLNPSDKPFINRKLVPIVSNNIPLNKLKTVEAITVNKVHGNQSSIDKIRAKYPVDIESMEGAAFFYVANMFQVPSLQVRAVSNYVEPRNRESWNVVLALKNLTDDVTVLMSSMTFNNFS